jgi:fructokinase
MATTPFSIGVDYGGTKTEVAVLDDTGAVRWRERVPTPPGYDARIAAAVALVQRAERELGVSGCSVGVGIPGTLTHEGRIKNANSTVLNGRWLERDLAAALGRPVRCVNDANCLALSEATDGAGAGADVVLAVILGTGCGAGIVVHGQVLGGPNGLAGEWGHNPLPWAAGDERPGPACYCGRHGCLETWLSGPGMAADYARRGGAALTAQQIVAGARAGDAACAATLDRWLGRLARGLAHVINLLDPDVIVLGGGLSLIEPVYTELPARLPAHVFSGGVQDVVRTRVLPSRHGDSSGVRGAAWLWRG